MEKVKVKYVRGGAERLVREPYATTLERLGVVTRVIEPVVEKPKTKKKAKKKTEKRTYERRDMKADD